MPKKRTLMDLGTPEPEGEINYSPPEGFAPYRPDFQFGFEPQSYAADIPVAPAPESMQFVTPQMRFQLPTFGGAIGGLPLGRLGELQLRGDFTRYPEGRPDFSLGFGFSRKF